MGAASVAIRRYQPDDRDAVLGAWRRASELAHPFLTAEVLDREAEQIAEVFLPVAETWVAVADGQVIGFVSIHDGDVGGLFVDPAHHRRGVGGALLDHVRARHGALELEVFEANHIGRAFYERAGFEEVSRVTDDATGEPSLRLRLSG